MANEQNLKPAWEKGKSGNPDGRPKGARNRTTIVREWLEAFDKVKNPLTGEVERMQIVDKLVLSMINKAQKGDVQAFKELMDSGYGKVKEAATESEAPVYIEKPSFEHYMNMICPDWLTDRPFVSERIIGELSDFLKSDKKVFMLSLPQGAGKSFIANKLTEWLLGCSQLSKNTNSQSVMRICNTDSNVTKFQAAISTTINSPEWVDIFGVHKLANDNKNGMRFEKSWNDNAFFSSAKSSVMSRRADYLIFDDIYTSMGEAMTATATDDYILKFQTMWRGRLKGSDIGKILMFGTRYTKSDFYKQIIEMYPDSFIEVSIPAINESGESFCEKTHPIDELIHDRETMNIDLFNAIYQQDPTAEGFINPFEDWNPVFAPISKNKYDYTYTVADPSFGVGGDYFMVGHFGINRNGECGLIDLFSERVCSDDMYINFIEAHAARMNYVERNGVGGMLINRVVNRTSAPVVPFQSIGNKFERIYMNANDIKKIVFNDSLNPDVFEQLTNFGKATRDDFPDMLSHFFNCIKIYGH